MTYPNIIKKHRRQATIINGQYKKVELEINQVIYPESPVTISRLGSKKAQQILLEQKEQRCDDLRWTVQELIKDLNVAKGPSKSSLVNKIQEMMEEIKTLETEIGGSGYAYLIQTTK